MASGVVTSRQIVPFYPVNGGATGAWTEEILGVGTLLDRFGGTSGNYLSPHGTPFQMRSLPPQLNNQEIYHVYEVLKPLKVNTATVAPWFYQPGGGIQYMTPTSINTLIDLKILGVIK